MSKIIYDQGEYVSSGYTLCEKCKVVHKYINCPMCGTVVRGVLVKCHGCEKLIEPTGTCNNCGKPLKIDSTTRGFVRRSKWSVLWLLAPITLLIVAGGLCLYFGFEKASVLPFMLAAIGVFVVFNELRSFSLKTSPCPKCGKPLKTNLARQCFACGHDWHD
jgi:hypothetical protein